MPDPARIAHAEALEIPVIIQGAMTVPGTDKREIFSENATTILVFEDGAMLHLRSQVAVGQVIFLHNAQNGKQALCKVLEAPPEGQGGHTHLEFNTPAPGFWLTAAAEREASEQNSQAAAAPQAHPEDDLAMMTGTASNIVAKDMTSPAKESGQPLREELMSAHEMAPSSGPDPSVHIPDFEPAVVVTSASPLGAGEPTGQQIDAALKQMSDAGKIAEAAEGAEAAEASSSDEQKHLAALMERDTRLAKFAAFKERQAEQNAKDAATRAAGKAPANAAAAAEAPYVDRESDAKSPWNKATFADKLTTGKNATYVTIGAAVLIAVAIGFIWHTMRGTIMPADTSESAAVQPKPAAPVAADANAPAANVAAPAGAAKSAHAPAANAAMAVRAPASERTASSRDNYSADASAATSRSRAQIAENSGPIIPARILSQPQPTLPPWAVGIQVDGVVTMDVIIDERGSVADTKILSGPRPLQREAERALSLWQFEPATSGGKPTASHMTLSVQFLPPPPPKRLY
jgi:TonB family protein